VSTKVFIATRFNVENHIIKPGPYVNGVIQFQGSSELTAIFIARWQQLFSADDVTTLVAMRSQRSSENGGQ
jgi:hypothetical protein